MFPTKAIHIMYFIILPMETNNIYHFDIDLFYYVFLCLHALRQTSSFQTGLGLLCNEIALDRCGGEECL